MSTSRRRFLLATAMLGAACAAPTAPAGTVGGDGFPRTVRDSQGVEVLVPARPQRVVVATEYTALDSLLALGLPPVAAVRRFPGDWPWTAAAGAGAAARIPEQLGGPNIEALARWAPDLLLLLEGERAEVVAKLGGLCPTVQYSGDDARACLRVVADALGVPERVAPLLTAFDAHVAAARERIRAAGRAGATFATFMVFPDGASGYFGMGKDATILLTDLGLRPIPLIAGTTGYGNLSAELIPMLDADVLIGRQENAGMDEVYTRYESAPLFRAIPAVARGHYTRLSLADSWALGNSSVLSWASAVDRLTEIVLALPG